MTAIAGHNKTIDLEGLESVLKAELKTDVLKCVQRGVEGGSISEGFIYKADDDMLFVKANNICHARQMFDGELRSLEVLHNAGVVRVPEPIKVVDLPTGGAVIVMEYLNLTGEFDKHAATFGDQLARLHLRNEENERRQNRVDSRVHKLPQDQYEFVPKFGFDRTTFCGFIPQDNTWQEDWTTFFARKIEGHMQLIDKKHGDREVRDLWSQLLPRLPKFFEMTVVKPALLHGDIRGLNVGETEEGPVTFDPYCFYGHSEFDLSLSKLFGGIPIPVYDAYHKVLPKAPGYEERLLLYTFFHYLNHWNHFPDSEKGYRLLTIDTLNALLKLEHS